ncbi:hypothetical protein FZ025_12675 [Xanthomonas hyacinthi]|uniref:hypothetical protein n=2 Tax=Xanthomonas hyacinthi TaxID=56455 RepID=UPI001303DEC5|nr:hypothetical protein [Xanthomonas hyacinthi]QGY77445.1 hypothetical protein FZ025_12675 [Xanthomonas hyacinthi]
MDFSKTQFDYAQLAANVYGAKSGVRSELNTLQLPNGWNMIGERISPTGFMAKAYRNAATGEVVVAYAETTAEDGAERHDGVRQNEVCQSAHMAEQDGNLVGQVHSSNEDWSLLEFI